MKEREKEGAEKPDQAVATTADHGGYTAANFVCVRSRGSLFPLGLESEEG